MNPKKVYQFQVQNEIGQQGEEVIRAHFEKYGIKTHSVDLRTNKTGVDFYVEEADGRKTLYEIKTDSMAGRTGNLFIENISNSSTGALGFLHTTKSDFILYYIPELFFYIELPTPELREFVLRYKNKFTQRSCQNPGYKSFGYLVGIEDILKEFRRYYINE